MNFSVPDFTPALPEIFLLCALSAILVVDLFIEDAKRFTTYLLTQGALAISVVVTIMTAHMSPVHTFSGMYVSDMMTSVLKVGTFLSVMILLSYSRDYLQKRGLFRGEFYTLTLFTTLGMLVMISASNFLTLYLGLELMSLSLYAMVALQRDSSISTEAAMKYFVLGALASGLLLYGMSMLYGATGSLDVSRILEVIRSGQANNNVLVFGVVFVVAGLGFKLGAVPFHMWIPDVYHGAPTAITLFIGSAPKLAAFAFVLRILAGGLQPLVHDWSQMLAILSVLSMGLGNITAIAQTNLKRMLAYSTISHMGFLLLGILSGTVNGYSSAMFYVLIYALMTLGGFGMIMLLSREGFEADNLDDYRGLNARSPWHAFVMLLLMFSMAGIPPTVGFYAKFSVLQAALNAGHLGIVIAAVMFSLIGAFYYLRIVKLMYFDAPVDHSPIVGTSDCRILLGVNGLAMLLLGILPSSLMALCAQSIQSAGF
ncbi:MAG: NADH-quinone oxidoreductase subunit NuoN [Burkholderiales bacterium]|nr:NADH-quinone oxidoreductase subunit NuoN [Burkholderiales bacterium]